MLYLWNLSASGYANSFYSAAVQAGSESWKAFFFGSLRRGQLHHRRQAAGRAVADGAVRAALRARAPGRSCCPQVLMGVATVGVLYAAVRRRFGAAAGLIAGAVLALTPGRRADVPLQQPGRAAGAADGRRRVLRAARPGGRPTKWLVWAGVAVGFAFLTKTLQAFLILPPLALVYAVCAPPVLPAARPAAPRGAAMVVSGGWWVAIVELWPASSPVHRRLAEQQLPGTDLRLQRPRPDQRRRDRQRRRRWRRPVAADWGETGSGGMFNANIGGQISWLLPAALILLVAGLVAHLAGAARTDAARAAFLVWGGSLLITGLVFSFMPGIFHEYYTVALAPYIAALVGMGAGAAVAERAHAARGARLHGRRDRGLG